VNPDIRKEKTSEYQYTGIPVYQGVRDQDIRDKNIEYQCIRLTDQQEEHQEFPDNLIIWFFHLIF
jgi:hypothetical protein